MSLKETLGSQNSKLGVETGIIAGLAISLGAAYIPELREKLDILNHVTSIISAGGPMTSYTYMADLVLPRTPERSGHPYLSKILRLCMPVLAAATTVAFNYAVEIRSSQIPGLPGYFGTPDRLDYLFAVGSIIPSYLFVRYCHPEFIFGKEKPSNQSKFDGFEKAG